VNPSLSKILFQVLAAVPVKENPAAEIGSGSITEATSAAIPTNSRVLS